MTFSAREARQISLAMGLLAVTMLTPAEPALAAGQTAVKAQHGFWQVVCKTPEGGKSELCALVQDVTSESNPDVQLSVQFHQGPDGTKVLRVHAPLGVLLPPGLPWPKTGGPRGL